MITFSDIEYAVNKLDYGKIQHAMTALNWTWAGVQPTTDDLRNQASDLLSRAVALFEDGKNFAGWASVASGGFQAQVRGLKNGKASLQVLFYVDNSEFIV